MSGDSLHDSLHGRKQLPERHVMVVGKEHVAAPDCWCRPTGEVVQSMHGPLGTIWLHGGIARAKKAKA